MDMPTAHERMRGWSREAEWPGRELNPRHADFQGVRGRSAENCGEVLETLQQKPTAATGGSAPVRTLQECGVQVLIRYQNTACQEHRVLPIFPNERGGLLDAQNTVTATSQGLVHLLEAVRASYVDPAETRWAKILPLLRGIPLGSWSRSSV
jgi:hypothetical protein